MKPSRESAVNPSTRALQLAREGLEAFGLTHDDLIELANFKGDITTGQQHELEVTLVIPAKNLHK